MSIVGKDYSIATVIAPDGTELEEGYLGDDLIYSGKTNLFMIKISAGTNIDLSMLTGLSGNIDWGDGTVNTNKNHTYANAGRYKIKLNFTSVTSIGNSFLYNKSELIELCVSAFKSITSIGSNFASSCPNLISVHFGALTNITSIGDNFLSNAKITKLDFRKTIGITSIGNNFLYNCSNLSEIDLSGLALLKSIGNYFLNGNKCVKINILSSTELLTIGDYFVNNCTELEDFYMYECKEIKTIGSYFMAGCSKMQWIDIDRANNLTSIGAKIFNNCTGLLTFRAANGRSPYTLVSWGDNLTSLSGIHVGSSWEAFKVAPVWKEKASLITY